ncbi:Uncharacterized protein Fot_34825 [Forsythia ovata]|uniref:Uncharacterized protein n=1 Tax=Forsythia ovata TaxID=205694 RepID=A0ABD1SMU5_9LAMI
MGARAGEEKCLSSLVASGRVDMNEQDHWLLVLLPQGQDKGEIAGSIGPGDPFEERGVRGLSFSQQKGQSTGSLSFLYGRGKLAFFFMRAAVIKSCFLQDSEVHSCLLWFGADHRF